MNTATDFTFAGGFTPDDVAPTCEGLLSVVRQAVAMPRAEFLQSAKRVMEAIWKQQFPSGDSSPAIINNVEDLIHALNNGWSYNTNEGDCLFTVFADIRPIGRNGQIVGVGAQAPDGAIVHDGRELVAWRERHQNVLRTPGHRKGEATRPVLRCI